MQRIRFGILGFGHHAAYRLVPAFHASEVAELTGFWRRDAAKAAQDAARSGAQAFASAEELCASPNVDAVFITSPDAVHLADAELAFAHGKPVLCEKPLTATLSEAQAMQAAATASGKLFGVAHHYRWAQSVVAMRRRIQAGEIGPVRHAHAEFNYAANRSPRAWITDPTLAAGGPLGDVGVHAIDTVRFALGSGLAGCEVLSVSTMATQDDLSGEVEATALLQLELSGGLLASVSVSARAAYRTALSFLGADGVLAAENGTTVDRPVEVVLRRGGTLENTQTYDNADAYTRMIDNFARAMRGEEEFLGPGHEGVTNQRILDAAFRSWRSGRREPVASS